MLGFVFLSLSSMEQIVCKEIMAEIEVFDSSSEGQKGSLKIDFNGHTSSSLIVSLVGPKKYFKKDKSG